MGEHIFAAAIRGNETKAFRAVEPFNGTNCHANHPKVVLKYWANARLHENQDRATGRTEIPTREGVQRDEQGTT
jgi:hypothetical protein